MLKDLCLLKICENGLQEILFLKIVFLIGILNFHEMYF